MASAALAASATSAGASLAGHAHRGSTREIVVFRVGDVACGMDILEVQEIKRIHSHTVVRRAPAYVRGLVNMRGQIVTLVDLRERLGLPMQPLARGAPAVIVAERDELIGLLVDEVDDVIAADAENFQPPPPNLRGIASRFVSAVVRTPERLIALVDKGRIARADDDHSGRDLARDEV